MTQPNPYGQPTPKKRRTVLWIVVGAVAAVLLLCGIGTAVGFSGSGEEPAAQVETTAPASPTRVEATPAQPTTKAPAAAATKAPATAAPKPAPKKLTAAQEQAIGTAGDYLDYGHFSRKGLIDQLEYEGFSKADATFAVDSLKVDWNAQAVGTAKDYLDTGHFSRKGLIEQLEYEGFTTAQAKHGVTGAGL